MPVAGLNPTGVPFVGDLIIMRMQAVGIQKAEFNLKLDGT